ncbi:MAG: ROK family protein, partial [Planctomycetes bacterium]|nr:ROK family protein [Planctomycetota bacterium]
MDATLSVDVPVRPGLDPGFLPAALWNRAYRERAAADPASTELRLGLGRADGTCFVHDARILPHSAATAALNLRYVERLVKTLLWQRGGSRIYLGGCPELVAPLSQIYAADGPRAFDHEIVGRKMFDEGIRVTACARDEVPPARARAMPLGRHLDGCRIGFDLGGSDRKCAALIDGQVVHSEEVEWDPYFESDPDYHYQGIMDSLRRAAAHLPRVDAIGGSAAGVYVGNEVKAASLFRGISAADYQAKVRRIFFRVQEDWGGVPFEVVNDGEVTALAGSMSIGDGAVLGVAMGTSTAAGYCDPDGHITLGLNELAFSPVDYRADAPADEWSGDLGCGVQYFSQQAVARLAPMAGIELPADMPFPEQLVAVQARMAAGDPRARAVYETIGDCFGWSIAHWAEFY